MNLRDYIVPVGVWAALIVGFVYFVGYVMFGYGVHLAVSASFFSLSLSIKAYANSLPKSSSGRKRRTKAR